MNTSTSGPASSAAPNTTQLLTFTPADIQLFQNVMKPFTELIETKPGGCESRQQQELAWLRVTKLYNNASPHKTQKVTITHLKQLWANMKTRARTAMKTNNKAGGERSIFSKASSGCLPKIHKPANEIKMEVDVNKDCCPEPNITSSVISSSSTSVKFSGCVCCFRFQNLAVDESEWECFNSMYQNMLFRCFNVKIISPVGLKVCNSCITRLRDACDFKLLVLSSQRDLAERIKILADSSIQSELDAMALALADSGNKHSNSADIYSKSPDIGSDSADTHSVPAGLCTDSADIYADSADVHYDSADIHNSDVRVLVPSNNKELATTHLIPKWTIVDIVENYPNGGKKTHFKIGLSYIENSLLNEYTQKYKEEDTHFQNALTILTCSNATPFVCKLTEGYKCYYCTRCFSDPELLRQHSRRDHADERKELLRKTRGDFYINLDVKDLICGLCSQQMESLDVLTIHLTEIHNKTFKTKFGNKNIPFILNNDLLNCQKCDGVFTSFRSLEAHMNSHFNHNICETCGEGFINKRRLSYHVQSRHRNKLYKCRYCDKIYTNTVKRNAHEISVHKVSKRFKCPKCSERFYVYKDRQQHMTDNHGMAPVQYRCELCNKILPSGSQLGFHKKQVHLKEKRYHCNYCVYKCLDKRRFQRHMVTHVGEKKYKCDICNKAYAYERSLVVHKWSHTNDSPHVCKVCGRSYTRNSNLRQHVKTQHPATH